MAEPLIVGLVSDLFFITPIDSAARALGYQVRWIERRSQIEPDELPAVEGLGRIGEPLSGAGAALIARLAEWQPRLVLLDLSSMSIPWPVWIAALKSSAATRRIPVLAFGPHTDLELRARALDAGCDTVVARSRLLSDLPELIRRHARHTDLQALQAECLGPLSDLAQQGIELFNRGEYFEAHEALEHAWNEDQGPARELYRGLLQVAVAYLQIQRRNYSGALKMFLRLRQWLDPLPEACRGVDVARLRQDARQARAALEALGPERIADFDPRLLKPVVTRER